MFLGKPALRPGRNTCVPAGVITAALLAFLVATRWPLAPRYLYYFDSANFALSLEKFDPLLHQPQPPGYPLFVLFIRMIHFWVRRPEQVLLVAGLLAAAMATVLIRLLAEELGGKTAGILAAVLLVSNPVFWFAGVTNQIRLFLAVCALAISLLAWRALTRGGFWFYATFAALGIAAGFRPEFGVLMTPLLIWTWHRTGRRLGRLAAAIGLLAGTILPWMAAIVIVSGGPAQFIRMIRDYAVVQFHPTSIVFGAPADSAWHMFAEAVIWNLLGALAWIWVVPLVRWRPFPRERREKAIFLGLAFLPAFLFSATVHIGDPDQALASIAILSTVGGILLAKAVEKRGPTQVFAVALTMIALHTLTFFKPPGKIARAGSYKAVAAIDRITTAAVTSIAALRADGPVTIVHYGASVSSRQVSYYFPDDYVVVLPDGDGFIETFYKHSPLVQSRGSAPMRPASRRILCLLPYNSSPGILPGWRRSGPVYYLDRTSDAPVRIGPYTLSPDDRLISLSQ